MQGQTSGRPLGHAVCRALLPAELSYLIGNPISHKDISISVTEFVLILLVNKKYQTL